MIAGSVLRFFATFDILSLPGKFYLCHESFVSRKKLLKSYNLVVRKYNDCREMFTSKICDRFITLVDKSKCQPVDVLPDTVKKKRWVRGPQLAKTLAVTVFG